MSARDDAGQRQTTRRDSEQDEVVESDATDLKERKEALDAEVDDILDEIDSVLEENAEEFVKGYVQKGGQ